MSYPAWPSTIPAPDDGCSGSHYRPAVKTEFEANYPQTRPAATRSRGKWPLHWGKLEETHYQTLETFFDTYQGQIFTWTNPRTGTAHNCIFSSDEIAFKYVEPDYREVDVGIEEI